VKRFVIGSTPNGLPSTPAQRKIAPFVAYFCNTNTTDYYSTAVAYLNEVVGNKALASLDNPEARQLVSKMKAKLKDSERRFADKTIVEFFKVFTRIIASPKDEKLRQVYAREWDLAHIGLPKVSKREQHHPTFAPWKSSTSYEAASGRFKGLPWFCWWRPESASRNCSLSK
jgi:hypothetical protein